MADRPADGNGDWIRAGLDSAQFVTRSRTVARLASVAAEQRRYVLGSVIRWLLDPKNGHGEPLRSWQALHGRLLALASLWSADDDIPSSDLIHLLLSMDNHAEPQVRHAVASCLGRIVPRSTLADVDFVVNHLASRLAPPSREDALSSSSSAESVLLSANAILLSHRVPIQRLLSPITTAAVMGASRFIREAAFRCITTCIEHHIIGPEQMGIIRKCLFDGLSDEFAEVRLAASMGARCFLGGRSPDQADDITLLPAMCLNRYDVADGVRNYSDTTWREIMGDRGTMFVTMNVSAFVAFYIANSQNHNREAACRCIGELSAKIPSAALTRFIPELRDTLARCCLDSTTTVREAAVDAIGALITEYPLESHALLPAIIEVTRSVSLETPRFLLDSTWRVLPMLARNVGLPEIQSVIDRRLIEAVLADCRARPEENGVGRSCLRELIILVPKLVNELSSIERDIINRFTIESQQEGH